MQKTFLFGVFLLVLISACAPVPAPPLPTSAPATLPATWTPTLPTALPTATEFPTFTPVPAFTPLATPTKDPLEALSARFQDSLFSPNGRWVAYRDPEKLRVVNSDDPLRVWTLPCTLFEECSTVYPVKWSSNGRNLYFVSAPSSSSAPEGISLVTAMGRIDVRTGKWEFVLPESDYHYDFAFSPEDEYLAYTQSSGMDVDDPSVTVGVITLDDKQAEHPYFSWGNAAYAGNIIWSPFKPRFVFVAVDPEQGSGVGYYDLATGFEKYALEIEPRDILLTGWGRNNLVSLEAKDWATNQRTYRALNPFTGDLVGTSITATPE